MAGRRKFQYQALAAPVMMIAAPIVVPDFGWFSELSQPPAYQIEPGLSAAWTQYVTGISVPAPAVVSVDSWLQPFSEPVRAKISILPAQQQSFATDPNTPVVVVVDYYVPPPLSEPVQVKRGVPWQQAFTTDLKLPSVIFVPGPLSEPVQIEPGLSSAWTQYITGISTPAPAVTAYNWFSPLNEPVRRKPDMPWRQPFTIDAKWTPPTVVTVTWGWLERLSEPSAYQNERLLTAAYGQVISAVGTGAAFVEYTFPPFSEPVRPKLGLHASQQQFFAIDPRPPVITTYNWFGQLSEPVRVKSTVAWQQFFTIDWKWQQPFLPNWYAPLSEPVRTKPDIRYREPFVTDWQWRAPISIAWYGWLSEPVRSKQAVAWQRPFTIDEQWTPPGVITDLRDFWFNWLSEPVRSKPDIRFREPFVTDWQWRAPISIPWFASLSEPVRSKQAVAWQMPLAWTAPPPPTADLRNFWFNWLAEPVRSKQAVVWQQPFTMDWRFTPPAVSYVPGPLPEPVRVRVAVVWQQPFTTDWKWVPPSRVSDWYRPFSEPVQSKKSVPWQQPYTTDWKWVPPSRVADWLRPFSEPVRSKQDIRYREPFTTDWKWQAPASAVWGWYNAFREPVRSLPGTHPSRQQFFVTDYQWRALISIGWYEWLGEPVRQKLGLHASRQMFFQMDWKWSPPIVTNINYTLAVTETGDVASLNYTSGSIVVGAYVTVTEIEVANLAQVTITEIE